MAERRENYFETNIAKYGENFIFNKSATDIQKDALKRIFKDMIYGNIDYAKFGKFFQIPTFVDNLIAVARSEAEIQYTTYSALCLWHRNTGDQNALVRAEMHYNAFWCLSNIERCLSIEKAYNYDIQYLTQLTTQLAAFNGKMNVDVKKIKMDYNKIIG